nr:hypothetical protein Iba_chr13aCG9660 [Ipomoea batatas]
METTLTGGGGAVVRLGYGERLSAVVGGAVDGRQWCGRQLATADSLHLVAFVFFFSKIIFFPVGCDDQGVVAMDKGRGTKDNSAAAEIVSVAPIGSPYEAIAHAQIAAAAGIDREENQFRHRRPKIS